MIRPGDSCRRCGKRDVEVIDDWVSDCCDYCNDRRIEHANARREWEYYHPPTESASVRDVSGGTK